MRKVFLAIAVLVIAFSACKKTEEVYITDNQAPPDTTLSDILVQTYINKAYISVLGRKPDDNEKAEAEVILADNNLAMEDRQEFIDIILAKPEYNEQLLKLASYDLLNAFDTAAITQQILLFEFLLTDSSYLFAFDLLEAEIIRLEEMKETLNDLNSGTIDTRGMHRRLINNYFYDQINMGTENFVRSVFENFLFRYPTSAELASATTMVDGFNAIVFLEDGDSKDDFMDIFLDSESYYEGQVRYLYLRYLFREPTSEEMSAYANQYKLSGNYKLLQKTVLTLDEYVGIN